MIETEIVHLATGEAAQALVPGVRPITAAERALAALVASRARRRGNSPLPEGGLFDETARNQQEMF